MHLEADIIKGKFGKNRKLKMEARDELMETKKGRILEKALMQMKEGKKHKHIKGHRGKQLV